MLKEASTSGMVDPCSLFLFTLMGKIFLLFWRSGKHHCLLSVRKKNLRFSLIHGADYMTHFLFEDPLKNKDTYFFECY